MEIGMLNKMLDMKKAIDNDGGDSILEMVEKLKEKNRSVKTNTEEVEKNLPNASFIDDVHSPAIKTIKSCIPYLEEKHQRNVALFIKVIELQNLMDKYRGVAFEGRKKDDENWKKGMLLAVKSHMGDEQRKKADMLLQMIELQDVFKLMNNVEKG